jgi:hypothetical protein
VRHNVLFQRKACLFRLNPCIVRGAGKPLIVGFGGRAHFPLKFRNQSANFFVPVLYSSTSLVFSSHGIF